MNKVTFGPKFQLLLICVPRSKFLVGSSPCILTNVLKVKSIRSSCDLGSAFFFFTSPQFLYETISLVSAKRILETYLSDVAGPSGEISFQKAQERL